MDRSSTITFRTEGMFTCSSCFEEARNVVGSIDRNREEFSSDKWRSIAVQCQGCTKWFIKCRYCDSSSSYSARSMELAYRNNYTRFNCVCNEASLLSGTAANHATDSNDVNDDNLFEANADGFDDTVTNNSQEPPPINFDAFNNNPPSFAYMSENNTDTDTNENHKGLRGMVYRALNKAPPATMPNSFSSAMLSLNLLIMTHVIMEVTGKTKNLVILLVMSIIQYIASEFETRTHMPSFPHTYEEAERICATKTDTSIWGQLPSEKVISLGDNKHVRISLDELIDHIMAFGAEIAWISDDKGNCNNPHANFGINGSQAAKEMLERCKECVRARGFNPDLTCFAYLVIWSDAFITAWIKQKDNSAWCQTVTIAPPEDNDRSEYHTHCIALGPKGADHNIVMDDLLGELEEIRNGKWRYYAREKRMVYTSFDVVCVLSDRPEKSELTKMLDHSGKTSKRSRFVTNASLDVLSSCDACFSSNISELFADADNATQSPPCTCPHCANWSYSADHLIWEEKCTVVDSYPQKKKSNKKKQRDKGSNEDVKEIEKEILQQTEILQKLQEALKKSKSDQEALESERKKRKVDVGDNGGEGERGQEDDEKKGGSDKGDDKGKDVGSRSNQQPCFPRGFSFNQNESSPLGIPEGRELPATYLAPREQTFEWLEKGCKATLHELTYNYSVRYNEGDGWTKQAATNYMSSMGISITLQDEIKKEADRRREEFKNSRLDTDDENKRGNLDWMNEIIPSLWTSGYKLDMFVDW